MNQRFYRYTRLISPSTLSSFFRIPFRGLLGGDKKDCLILPRLHHRCWEYRVIVAKNIQQYLFRYRYNSTHPSSLYISWYDLVISPSPRLRFHPFYWQQWWCTQSCNQQVVWGGRSLYYSRTKIFHWQ